MPYTACVPPVLALARADQVATLYRSWHRTTVSMVLGAFILCGVLWDQEAGSTMAAWLAAILANQAWRGVLARAYRIARPAVGDASRWGAYWAIGSTLAGALWGAAAVVMFPASPEYQALFIVCQFSVILGGLSLTAVYRPSFYGFVLAALAPLIVRVAAEGDRAHLFTALVLGVVLGFVLAFGRQVNEVLTQSLAMRYENVDLIGELKAQTGAALAARAAAETANRAKSRFLAAASHDLRQPLHAMGLFAAALVAKARDPGVKPLVASIRASVEALEGLFAQLLDLSHLEAGALHPAPRTFALEPMLSRLAAEMAPQALASGLSLRKVATRVTVTTDPILLERILANFVTNAVRYTRTGGIVVGARRRGRSVRIDVVDTGVGIAAADCARVFDEFVQLATTPRPNASGRGMGLGLAIVRRLADLLGHPIEVESVPGRGSRFSIVVPAARDPMPRPDSHPAREPAGVPASQALAGRHVVVVDDDPAVLSAMHALFTAWDAAVTIGADAGSVLAALPRSASSGQHADLLIADLRLAEGASGIDAIAELRDALGARLPALILSGDASETARAETAAAGVRLLLKPVVASALREAAEDALRLSPRTRR
jgi:signal transduction histidine kinase/ActR/RegA family two-component response regulator